MNTNEEVDQEENKLHDSSLNDLPITTEHAESTKGGEGRNGNLQITQLYFGSCQP